MNIFKLSYKMVRNNSKEIYKGFGFKHLSDATQYYVHPNNQSFKGSTTLCQPIGEAVTLFALLLSNIASKSSEVTGNFYWSDEAQVFFIELSLPDDWRENGVVEANIYHYRALLKDNQIAISVYDEMYRLIDGNMEYLHPLYKLLPCFTVLLAAYMQTSSDFLQLINTYVENPTADVFVNIHEDFYQSHKAIDYDIAYTDLSGFDVSEMLSFADSYRVIRDNKAAIMDTPTVVIDSFKADDFLPEYRKYIPKLSEEFVLPLGVKSICSAVTHCDARAVLFHGPSGTGKTMSCKLLCEAVGLPIMETINCTENLDEFVLGKFIPDEDRIVFRESFVTKAIRYGGAVIFEEINFSKPQYLSFLNSLLDDNGFVRLDNGEVVKRHENFRFFATMNLGYFGTKELNQALYNRFNIIVEVAELPNDAIARMLTARVPECKPVVDKLLGVYQKIKKRIAAEELDVVISPRNLENWAKLAKYEGYILAAEKTIIPIAKCDRIFEEALRGIIVLYKWK